MSINYYNALSSITRYCLLLWWYIRGELVIQ